MSTMTASHLSPMLDAARDSRKSFRLMASGCRRALGATDRERHSGSLQLRCCCSASGHLTCSPSKRPGAWRRCASPWSQWTP
eukprot:3640012-Prymnesium_polylepis.1